MAAPKKKTHCKNGHDLTAPDSMYAYNRNCKRCARDRANIRSRTAAAKEARERYRIRLRDGVPLTGQKRGQDHHAAKLTPEAIASILLRAKAGERRRLIANDYGISTGYLSHIISGKWLSPPRAIARLESMESLESQ